MNPSYNDSFGSSGSSNGRAPITSSGSDIILTPSASPQKSSRRSLIIAGIVLIIVAIGFGVGAILMMGHNSSTNNAGMASYVNKYNIFANYIINGSQSNNRITGEYDKDTVYYIDDVVIDETEVSQKDFFAQATTLWQSFIEDYDTTEESQNSSYAINSYIASLEQGLEFANSYIDAGDTYSAQAAVVRSYLGLSDDDTLYKYEIFETVNHTYQSIGRYCFIISNLITDPSREILDNVETEEGENEA